MWHLSLYGWDVMFCMYKLKVFSKVIHRYPLLIKYRFIPVRAPVSLPPLNLLSHQPSHSPSILPSSPILPLRHPIFLNTCHTIFLLPMLPSGRVCLSRPVPIWFQVAPSRFPSPHDHSQPNDDLFDTTFPHKYLLA